MRKIDLNKVVLSEFFDLELLKPPFYIQIIDGKLEFTDKYIAVSQYVDVDKTLNKKYEIKLKPTKNSYIDFNNPTLGKFYHRGEVYYLLQDRALDIERLFFKKDDINNINEINITNNGVKLLKKVKNLTKYIEINHYNNIAMGHINHNIKCYFKLDREFKGNWKDYSFIIRSQYLMPYNHYIFDKFIYQINKNDKRYVAMQIIVDVMEHKLPQFNQDKAIKIDKNILNEIKKFKKQISLNLSHLNSCINIHIENNQIYLYIININKLLYYKKELGYTDLDNQSFCIHYNDFINLLKVGDLYISYDKDNNKANIMIYDNDIKLYAIIDNVFLGKTYPR